MPWPADYGGVVDLLYKIQSLHALGIKIHLHCFVKDRQPVEELHAYCESVDYYKRKKGLPALSISNPYIVQSRSSVKLLQRLQQDNHPILMEGIHCTYLLKKGLLPGRKVFVRLHNVEYRYYRQLAKHEVNFLRKAYYLVESYLLERYEKAIAVKAPFWTVSSEDCIHYRKKFGATDISFLPVFLPWQQVNSATGKGCYCLYHGNLSVNENAKAADWLLNNVFNKLEIPFVVAGRNPSLPLRSLAHAHLHTCITVNPSEKEMQDMISKAQVNILPSFNKTGVKLKLLNALYNGRHCLVNKAAIAGSGLEALCHMAETAEDFSKQAATLYRQDFTSGELEKRKQVLEHLYNNEKNARQLIAWIY